MGNKPFLFLSLLIGLVLAVWVPAYFFLGIDPLYFSGLIKAKLTKPSTAIVVALPTAKPGNLTGFKTNSFAANLGKITSMGFDQGILYVTNQEGEVVRLIDSNGDGIAETRRNFATGLDQPNGIAFFSNFVYVSQKGKVTTLVDKDLNGTADEKEDILIALPAGKFKTNSLAIGPDEKLYIAQGATSDKSEFGLKRWEASILRANLAGGDLEYFATGLRESRDLAFNSATKELFAVDDSQDFPSFGVPDELNLIVRKGDYGWPNCWGNNAGTSCKKSDIPALVSLGEHTGPSGMVFYTGSQFPDLYRNNLFITLYGSPSNDPSVGKKVIRVILNKDQSGYKPLVEDFATGFNRPVDVVVGDDGCLYVADQATEKITRICAQYN